MDILIGVVLHDLLVLGRISARTIFCAILIDLYTKHDCPIFVGAVAGAKKGKWPQAADFAHEMFMAEFIELCDESFSSNIGAQR
jgi:hypothetical protein